MKEENIGRRRKMRIKNNNKEWEKCPCGRPLRINKKGEFLYCYKCEPTLREENSL